MRLGQMNEIGEGPGGFGLGRGTAGVLLMAMLAVAGCKKAADDPGPARVPPAEEFPYHVNNDPETQAILEQARERGCEFNLMGGNTTRQRPISHELFSDVFMAQGDCSAAEGSADPPRIAIFQAFRSRTGRVWHPAVILFLDRERTHMIMRQRTPGSEVEEFEEYFPFPNKDGGVFPWLDAAAYQDGGSSDLDGGVCYCEPDASTDGGECLCADGGSTHHDGGTSPGEDGGSGDLDGGTRRDGGTTPVDGGTRRDGGTPRVDGGTPRVDGGTRRDGGTTPGPDGGGLLDGGLPVEGDGGGSTGHDGGGSTGHDGGGSTGHDGGGSTGQDSGTDTECHEACCDGDCEEECVGPCCDGGCEEVPCVGDCCDGECTIIECELPDDCDGGEEDVMQLLTSERLSGIGIGDLEPVNVPNAASQACNDLNSPDSCCACQADFSACVATMGQTEAALQTNSWMYVDIMATCYMIQLTDQRFQGYAAALRAATSCHGDFTQVITGASGFWPQECGSLMRAFSPLLNGWGLPPQFGGEYIASPGFQAICSTPPMGSVCGLPECATAVDSCCGYEEKVVKGHSVCPEPTCVTDEVTGEEDCEPNVLELIGGNCLCAAGTECAADASDDCMNKCTMTEFCVADPTMGAAEMGASFTVAAGASSPGQAACVPGG